ncbi:MAG: SDR family oxidoreductase [Acidobacteriaceae bacterium]|nr:SDR family oxidoreductase [Acidobacteriaceae bacterium]
MAGTHRFLEGKTAIVTGGTKGIGFEIAHSLVDAGASVLICGRSQNDIDRALAKLVKQPIDRVKGQAADVSKVEEVAKVFEVTDREFGGLDILVNNAGVGKFASTAALTVEEWRQMIDTNLNGVFYCSREALSRFGKRGGGYVINISSLAGKNAFAGGAAYNASKFGLNGFSEAMMLDHRHDNVRVSYIMPGSVDTSFGSNSGTKAEWKIAPEDIAEIVLLLLRMPSRTLISRVEVRPSRPKG